MGITYSQIKESNSKRIGSLTTDRAYIFYQPGDLHDPMILENLFSGVLVRIGDLHHLQNPLINAIQFISSIYRKIERVSLNTNPSFVPLFNILFPGCEALPISELTIHEGLLDESMVVAPNKHIRRSYGRVAYIGPVQSAYHPRRTDWIHRLLASEDRNRIDMFPSMNPKDWLACCSGYNAVLGPTLNSQWSHNLFVPNLGGSRIISDCLAAPCFSYYTNFKTRSNHACLFTGSFASFRSSVRMASYPHDLEAGAIAHNARKFMEAKRYTLQEFFSSNGNLFKRTQVPLVQREPASYFLILVAANVFEIIQEVIRLFVVYERFLLACQSTMVFKLLSTYFPHPRLILKQGANTVTGLTHECYVELMGIDNETGGKELLLRLDLALDPNDKSLVQFSSRLFEPFRLSVYEVLREQMSSSISSAYRPAEFPQKLLNSVTVRYF